MDKKDIGLLHELFNKSKCKTITDILNLFKRRNDSLQEILMRDIVPDHLVRLDASVALMRILIPSDIDSILNVAIYYSFINSDFSFLNNAIFSYNRLAGNRVILVSSGNDHSTYFPNVVNSFAGNDLQLIQKMFEEGKGLAVNGHRFNVVASNLIISILHKKKEWVDKSVVEAKKYMLQKLVNFDRAVINYLVCLACDNGHEANECLSQVCDYYKKSKWIHDFKSPFLAVFGLFIHGLYNLGYHTLSAATFNAIEQPVHSVFWKPLTAFQARTSFNQGTALLNFEGELSGLNYIYN